MEGTNKNERTIWRLTKNCFMMIREFVKGLIYKEIQYDNISYHKNYEPLKLPEISYGFRRLIRNLEYSIIFCQKIIYICNFMNSF